MIRVKALMSQFKVLHFQHIYREFNMEADDLSKKALGIGTNLIFWEEYKGESLRSSGTMELY